MPDEGNSSKNGRLPFFGLPLLFSNNQLNVKRKNDNIISNWTGRCMGQQNVLEEDKASHKIEEHEGLRKRKCFWDLILLLILHIKNTTMMRLNLRLKGDNIGQPWRTNKTITMLLKDSFHQYFTNLTIYRSIRQGKQPGIGSLVSEIIFGLVELSGFAQ